MLLLQETPILVKESSSIQLSATRESMRVVSFFTKTNQQTMVHFAAVNLDTIISTTMHLEVQRTLILMSLGDLFRTAGEMEPSVMSLRIFQDRDLVKTAATSRQASGLTVSTGHVVKCLVGEPTHVAWQAALAIAAAMGIVGSGSGLEITATEKRERNKFH
jgi:hypothetical protein